MNKILRKGLEGILLGVLALQGAGCAKGGFLDRPRHEKVTYDVKGMLEGSSKNLYMPNTEQEVLNGIKQNSTYVLMIYGNSEIQKEGAEMFINVARKHPDTQLAAVPANTPESHAQFKQHIAYMKDKYGDFILNAPSVLVYKDGVLVESGALFKKEQKATITGEGLSKIVNENK